MPRDAAFPRHPSILHIVTPLRVLVAVLAAALLVGCTTKIAYRYADWYLLWKVDHYVDLNGQQRSYVRNRLKDLLAHHQREALPVYEQFLSEVQLKMADRLTHEELDWIFERYHQLRADLVDRVVPDGAMLLTSINEGQVRHLERMLGKDNEKAGRDVGEEVEVRQVRRTTEALELLRDWLGPLSRDQEQRIKELVRTLPDIDRGRLTYIQDREQELFNLLRLQADSHLVRERLRLWLLFPERIAPAHGRSVDQLRQSLKHVVLAVDELITPPQRAHALHRLQKLINDIHSLATS
jgi:hypothetical protein